MKINEIILLESDAELRKNLEQEFDDEYGDGSGNKLPQFIMLDKASVVALAVGYIKRPKWSPGMALKYAVKQLYPNFSVTFSGMDDNQKSNFKKAKPDQDADKDGREDRLQKKAAPDKLSAEPKKKRGAQVGNQNAVKDYTAGDGNTRQRILKKLNPTAGLNTTDLGTTFTSALGKAKSKARNLDALSINKSNFKA